MYIAMVMEAGEVDLSKFIAQKQRYATDNSNLSNQIEKGGGSGSNLVTEICGMQSSTKPNESSQNQDLNPFLVRMLWQEMLEIVDHIHNNRVVHGQ